MAGIPLRTLAAMALDGDGQADVMCSRLESRYDTYRHNRAEIERTMAHIASDGRPPVVLPSSGQYDHAAVNGQEIRAADRWQGTPADRVCDSNGQPIDRTCYRLMADGSRVPFDPPVRIDESRSNGSRAVSEADRSTAALQRLTAALISPADRSALADGTA